jgi:DNA-binding MarR family transcriptional regulator
MTQAKLKHQIVEAGHTVIRAVLRETLNELLGMEITMAQFKALAVMDKQQACTMGALSEQLGVKAPAASLLVDKLVGAGLAFRLRDVEDARRVIVRPTVKGANLVGRVRHGGVAVLERWAERLSYTDLVSAARGLAALAEVAAPTQNASAVAGR